MKILSIKHKETIYPQGSCGTGYSVPDYWFIELDDSSKYEVCIDIWYMPIGSIRKEFLSSLGWLRNAENIDEVFEMYASQIANKRCPWSMKEILEANQMGLA